jgi:hypothetical protein
MNTLEEARKEYIESRINNGPNNDSMFVSRAGAKQLVGESFDAGSTYMRTRAITTYRNLCPSYKVRIRYECGNYSHRQEWKTKTCDMNCEYMKNFLEKI